MRRRVSLLIALSSLALSVPAQLFAQATLRVIAEPPDRLYYDSLFAVHPIAELVKNDGNAVKGTMVTITLCHVGDLPPRPSRDSAPDRQAAHSALFFKGDSCRTSDNAALVGKTWMMTDESGKAEFANLRFRGPPGRYRFTYATIDRSAEPVTGALFVYDPQRSYDRSTAVVSAIKTLAGVKPDDEFFDIRFRARISDEWHLFSAFDLALANRGTDSVGSTAKRLAEGWFSIARDFAHFRDHPSMIEQRALFYGFGGQLFNTVPYVGLLLGGVEHAGSAFDGTNLSVSVLRRWNTYGDTTVTTVDPNDATKSTSRTYRSAVVVDDAIVETSRWNLGINFFLRSSKHDFFKILTVRGALILPLGDKHLKETSARFAISVPIGTLFTY